MEFGWETFNLKSSAEKHVYSFKAAQNNIFIWTMAANTRSK